MVASGRVSDKEAERLRAASDEDSFEAGIREIRARHAGAKLDAAVQAGQMTREEADANLERLRQGEHPRALKAHLRNILQGPRDERAGPHHHQRSSRGGPAAS